MARWRPLAGWPGVASIIHRRGHRRHPDPVVL